MLKIRPHHLLCLQGFQGYGYDQNFTENMKLIHNRIMKDNETIQIVNGTDDICKSCPNNKEGICLDIEENFKILKLDNFVLDKILKETSKKEFLPNELFDLINNKIFTSKEEIENTCIPCKWYDLCLWAKSKN